MKHELNRLTSEKFEMADPLENVTIEVTRNCTVKNFVKIIIHRSCTFT